MQQFCLKEIELPWRNRDYSVERHGVIVEAWRSADIAACCYPDNIAELALRRSQAGPILIHPIHYLPLASASGSD